MCILDVFFPVAWKKTWYVSKISLHKWENTVNNYKHMLILAHVSAAKVEKKLTTFKDMHCNSTELNNVFYTKMHILFH